MWYLHKKTIIINMFAIMWFISASANRMERCLHNSCNCLAYTLCASAIYAMTEHHFAINIHALCPHYGRLSDVFWPHARCPVAHREEVFGEERVALQRVHRTVVTGIYSYNFFCWCFGFSVARHNRPLVSADHELCRLKPTNIIFCIYVTWCL